MLQGFSRPSGIFIVKVVDRGCSSVTEFVRVYSRDATIPFFQIRSDPENSEYRPIPIRSQFFFFFSINVEFLYFCVTLLCVKHNLLDNFILMKNNMKIYIGAVYTWSLHAFCNINHSSHFRRWSGPHSRQN